MKKIFLYFFGKRKDGKCRWWKHDYSIMSKHDFMVGNGSYIQGHQIENKYTFYEYTCSKCGKKYHSDAHRVF